MMMGARSGMFLRSVAVVIYAMAAMSANAANLAYDLGNTNPGFNPGDTPEILALIGAQDGQSSPFDQGYGDDSLQSSSASFTFTFSYPSIADALTAAFLDIGIVDADGASPGNQVAALTVSGTDFTAAANAAFNAGGDSGVYDVFEFNLGSILASLQGGSVGVTLTLMGPVLSPVLFSDPPEFFEEPSNGAFLIFSRLRLTTSGDGGGGTPVPEPGTLALLMFALPALLLARRRRDVAII